MYHYRKTNSARRLYAAKRKMCQPLCALSIRDETRCTKPMQTITLGEPAFSRTLHKDERGKQRHRAWKFAVGDIHAQFRRPFADQPRAGSQMFAVYTRTLCATYAPYLRRHTLAHGGLLSRHFRPFTTECNFVPTWHIRRHNIPRDRLPLCLRSLVLRNAIKILAMTQAPR